MNICLFLTNVYVLYGDILHIVYYYYFFFENGKVWNFSKSCTIYIAICLKVLKQLVLLYAIYLLISGSLSYGKFFLFGAAIGRSHLPCCVWIHLFNFHNCVNQIYMYGTYHVFVKREYSCFLSDKVAAKLNLQLM